MELVKTVAKLFRISESAIQKEVDQMRPVVTEKVSFRGTLKT
jgi:hypothetical protein